MNLLKALLVLTLLLGSLAFLLPEEQVVQRSREMAVSPQRLWPLLAEPRRWARWTPWVAREPGMGQRHDGPVEGVGAQWHWDSLTQGSGQARIELAEAPRHLGYVLTFDDLGFEAQGSFELEPVGAATRVSWRLVTHAGWNPLLRWFGLGLEALVGSHLEAGLVRLERAAQP